MDEALPVKKQQTVLVDAQGWTMYELGEVVSDEKAMAFLSERWFGPYHLRLRHDPDVNPPQTWIEAEYIPTRNRTVAAFIRVREMPYGNQCDPAS